MAKQMARYEFKPFDGSEIEVHGLVSLFSFVIVRQGMTDREAERVVFAGLGSRESVVIKKVGEFRRLT